MDSDRWIYWAIVAFIGATLVALYLCAPVFFGVLDL